MSLRNFLLCTVASVNAANTPSLRAPAKARELAERQLYIVSEKSRGRGLRGTKKCNCRQEEYNCRTTPRKCKVWKIPECSFTNWGHGAGNLGHGCCEVQEEKRTCDKHKVCDECPIPTTAAPSTSPPDTPLGCERQLFRDKLNGNNLERKSEEKKRWREEKEKVKLSNCSKESCRLVCKPEYTSVDSTNQMLEKEYEATCINAGTEVEILELPKCILALCVGKCSGENFTGECVPNGEETAAVCTCVAGYSGTDCNTPVTCKKDEFDCDNLPEGVDVDKLEDVTFESDKSLSACEDGYFGSVTATCTKEGVYSITSNTCTNTCERPAKSDLFNNGEVKNVRYGKLPERADTITATIVVEGCKRNYSGTVSVQCNAQGQYTLTSSCQGTTTHTPPSTTRKPLCGLNKRRRGSRKAELL